MRFVSSTQKGIARNDSQPLEMDFEQLGFETMTRTKNKEAAIEICGLKIHAYEDGLRPTMADVRSAIAERQTASASLWSYLYDRDEPVRDPRMLAQQVGLWILGLLTAFDALASVSAHIVTFSMFGWGIWAGILGPAITGLAVIAGYLAFDRLLSMSRLLQAVVITGAALLAFWGLLQLSQARAVAVTQTDTGTQSPQSYVDDSSANAAPEPTPADDSSERVAREKLRGAWVTFMLSADLVLGILLGTFVQLRTGEDYTAWRKLKSLTEEISAMELELIYLLSLVEIAKKKCMAGILRAMHTPQRKHVPYFQIVRIIGFAFVLLVGRHMLAQDLRRGILIDTSTSIASGSANQELFRAYLEGTRRLLETEPPDSRVVVCVITNDSFGGVQELLKGWTPEQHGVFTNNLNQARHQLAASFERKATSLAPVAAGTDIIGGLWHLKTLLESDVDQKSSSKREIWIFSDMMNETRAFMMPALLAGGSDQLLTYAKSNRLVVPLHGYTIHVVGASTRGLTPQTWNTVREFWSAYFRESGAELSSYSAESSTEVSR